MSAGVRTPSLLRGENGLGALASAVACWFAAPAEAAVVPADVQAPTAAVAAVAEQSPVAHVLDADADRPIASAEPAVSDVADAATGAATHTTVDAAVQTIAPVQPAPSAPPAAPAATAGPRHLVDHIAASASAAIRGRGARPRLESVRRHDGAAARPTRPTGPPTGSVTAEEAGGVSRDAVTGPALPASDEGSLDPTSGGVDGSPASGASAAFSFGGSAVLITAVFMAASRQRRRLPGLRVMCPPAAFVPLLERPG
jgi:hypothetical protein